MFSVWSTVSSRLVGSGSLFVSSGSSWSRRGRKQVVSGSDEFPAPHPSEHPPHPPFLLLPVKGSFCLRPTICCYLRIYSKLLTHNCNTQVIPGSSKFYCPRLSQLALEADFPYHYTQVVKNTFVHVCSLRRFSRRILRKMFVPSDESIVVHRFCSLDGVLAARESDVMHCPITDGSEDQSAQQLVFVRQQRRKTSSFVLLVNSAELSIISISSLTFCCQTCQSNVYYLKKPAAFIFPLWAWFLLFRWLLTFFTRMKLWKWIRSWISFLLIVNTQFTKFATDSLKDVQLVRVQRWMSARKVRQLGRNQNKWVKSVKCSIKPPPRPLFVTNRCLWSS